MYSQYIVLTRAGIRILPILQVTGCQRSILIQFPNSKQPRTPNNRREHMPKDLLENSPHVKVLTFSRCQQRLREARSK